MARITLLLLTLSCGSLSSFAQRYAAPEPYGGKQAVEWMLEKELNFPPHALAAGVKGEVKVSFQVRADGSLSGVRTALPLTPACDAEARRLVQLIRWQPASVGGTPQDHDHTIAIPFNAKRYMRQREKVEPCPPPATPPAAAPGFTLYARQEVDTSALPQIPGGLRGLPQYLANNLKYPPEAFRLDIQGPVTIEFVVETSGNISNLRTLNFLGGGCDTEAMRLARTICWTPAIKDGQYVRSIMQLDIAFRLNPSLR